MIVNKERKLNNEIKTLVLIHRDEEFNRIIYHVEGDDEMCWTSITTFEKLFLKESSFNNYNIIINLISLENFDSYKRTLKLNKIKNGIK